MAGTSRSRATSPTRKPRSSGRPPPASRPTGSSPRPTAPTSRRSPFAGNVTYPKAPELREAAARVPADRLLAETDSPYLAPQPVRGQRNEPAYVMHTLEALAAARGDDPGDLEAQIDANASAAFGL